MAWDDVLVALVSKYTAATHNEMVNQIKARILHSLSTAENDFLLGSGSGSFIKKTLAEVKIILGVVTGTTAGTLCAGDDSRLSNSRTPSAHNLIDTTGHPVTGLTTGHFLKATGPTGYAFGAHGLTAADVGAATEAYAEPQIQQYQLAKITDSAGALRRISCGPPAGHVSENGDGDRAYFYVWKHGSESILDVDYQKHYNRPIVDLYINGVLDSSGYDMYATGGEDAYMSITLTLPLVSGKNTVEFRTNGKNAASSEYYVKFSGMYLR